VKRGPRQKGQANGTVKKKEFLLPKKNQYIRVKRVKTLKKRLVRGVPPIPHLARV